MEEPIYFYSATSLAKSIATGHLSSFEIVEAHISRIKALNPSINAVVTLCELEALESARQADAQVRNGGRLGKLHGVPILIKDSYRAKGIRSTFGGLPQFRNHFPKTDCEQIRRLKAAGAIILGRTNLPLLAFDWQSRNPLFKEAKNPFDSTRTPGGSSGGAAAAIAAGFAPLDLGSDLGGSTRYPSHCCGVYGLRTTDGLLPIADLGPENEPQAFERLVTCGPIARHLEDVKLMLEVLVGEADDNGTTDQQGQHLRIAFGRSLLNIETDAETSQALENLIERLRHDGHQITEAKPKIDFAEAYRIHGLIAGHEFARVLPWFFKTKFGQLLLTSYLLRLKMGFGPFTKWISRGIRSDSKEYESALLTLKDIHTATDAFFEDYDLWILPVSPTKAIRRQRYGFPLSLNDRRISYSAFLGSYLAPTATMGTPALAVPIQSASGFPMAVQIHGPRFADFDLLRKVGLHLDKHAYQLRLL